jgi:threonine 3-dehydrogenase
MPKYGSKWHEGENLGTIPTGRMKCLKKTKAEVGIWMGEEDIPSIRSTEVLIKIKQTAICGTDIHIYNWDDWAQSTIPIGMTVGHEYVGEVVAIGERVKDIKVGQRVTGEGHLVGTSSRNVRAGKFHLDPDTKGIGVNVPGAFAQYLALPAFNAIPLPDNVSDDMASIMDPFGNATHAALSFDLVGEDVLITGAGPIGIMAAAICRHVGARNVVLTDVNDSRLELAKKVSNITTVNPTKEKLEDVMAELDMQEGFDVGLEMSGNGIAFQQMIDNMMMGGKIALLGIPPQDTVINWQTVIFKAITIKAIYGREMYETWYKMISMIQSGLDISKVITHHYPIDEFQTGFDAMLSGKSGKVILHWD